VITTRDGDGDGEPPQAAPTAPTPTATTPTIPRRNRTGTSFHRTGSARRADPGRHRHHTSFTPV